MILEIPQVLDADGCAELVTLLDRHGGEESRVEQVYAGAVDEAVAHEVKRRRDLVLEGEIEQLLANRLARTLFPAIYKAAAYKCTRFEGFKVALYPEGGLFRAHRDDVSPATAHRRWSLTLALNDGYEGGALAFPEKDKALSPPRGGAVVFRSHLLHEVLPVTKGVRYALISFLW